MSRTRTLIAWLVVIGLHLVPCNVYAQDAGPGMEVRAIRHDLPIILAGDKSASIHIDGVVVLGDEAVAKLSGGSLAHLSRILSRWWFVNSVDAWGAPSPCSPNRTAALPPILALARTTWPEPTAPAREASAPERIKPVADRGDCGVTGLYGTRWLFAKNDAIGPAGFTLRTRPPTVAESWLSHGGNAYCYLSATYDSASVMHVSSGTTLDVWFPFVLDPSKTYSLTIAHVTPIIGPIDGRLQDNALHFVLPAFAIGPGVTIMGEIDGDPLDNP